MEGKPLSSPSWRWREIYFHRAGNFWNWISRGDNYRGLYIWPNILCSDPSDVVEDMNIYMESMMNEVDSYYNIQMNFVIDLEELSLSNFVVNPPWMQSWENAYNVLYESLYKVNLDNIVSYPFSVASTSASKNLMVFYGWYHTRFPCLNLRFTINSTVPPLSQKIEWVYLCLKR